ncbi:MAG: hypothetical protein E6R13_08745 [Spirochaetes bacterium]|nr:MAG: hypothetical protein E6R13_08745 [Spirochaetota bacterium]
MKVYNALQLKKGAKGEGYPTTSSLTQPIQFLPAKQKDDDWAAWNMDWLELQGIQFLKMNSRRLLKNYKLAKGIIDKSDYIIEEDNEYRDLMDVLTKEDSSALELKFYPIIPNVVNVLCGEFSKRFHKVQFRAVDDLSYNEMLEQKRAMVEENLLADAESKLIAKMIDMGMDPASEEAQQMLDPNQIKSLPEIEDFFAKDYRSLVEEWASHQLNVDEERFKMQELEERAFRDMLITDREFWHFRMMEDDYEVELWNPVLTFYQKSPDMRYISEGNFVGKLDLMTVSDVIDKYGYLMTQEQLESLQKIHPARSAIYQVNGYQNDGSYYDPSRSYEWNTNAPGLDYRRYVSNWANDPSKGGDIVSAILEESDDLKLWGQSTLMRVCTTYWKTQRKVGHLTRITDDGEVIQEIVDETYAVTEKPIYDNTLFKNKTKQNLLQGEHIDWIWINETWGGVKIGPNLPAFWRSNMGNNINPIYLGINRPKPGRIPFQFKGAQTLYGCKLPVEGRVFSDRNTRSVALVDLMKAYQVGYNMVNNQIADILVDELGTVIMFDQNALPRHSMGEDWGKGNYAKAYVAMKDFQMLPLDTSITNTENATNFNHYQVLNMEQSSRLMSRIQLANYFKQQAFEAIGINMQRMGGPIAQETATGVTQALNQSYAQTEVYFTQHSDHLMPRVHQMRTDLAQYYHSSNPSVRLSYITSEAEKVNFTINGTDLLLRDFNIYATTKTNHRAILDQLKQLALSNNTSGASIYDLGNIIKADSIAEVSNILKDTEQKQLAIRQQEMQQQREMQEQQLKARAEEEQMKLQFQASEKQKDRQNQLMVAEIRAAGYGSMQDINENMVSDYQDAMKDLKETTQYQEQMNFKREQAAMTNSMTGKKLDVEKDKLATQRQIAQTQLEIARENKNKYDSKSKNDKNK